MLFDLQQNPDQRLSLYFQGLLQLQIHHPAQGLKKEGDVSDQMTIYLDQNLLPDQEGLVFAF